MSKTVAQLFAQAKPTPQAEQRLDIARRVFQSLHAQYGNLFLSKYATGALKNGEDAGVLSAMTLWGHALRNYDESTIKAALTQCMTDHVQYPPNLPEFLRICEARRPREAYKSPVLALPVNPELAAKRAAEAKAKLAEMRASMDARNSAGLTPLKQAIANALAAAGGDEVGALLRLDRMLAPGAAA